MSDRPLPLAVRRWLASAEGQICAGGEVGRRYAIVRAFGAGWRAARDENGRDVMRPGAKPAKSKRST